MRLAFQFIVLVNIYAAAPVANNNSSDGLTRTQERSGETVFVYTFNGDGAEETDCSNDGGSQCASCDAGFELQQQCESESVSFTSGLSDLAGVNIKTSTHIHFSRTVMRCVSR